MVTELRNNRMFIYLAVLVISSTMGLYVWRTLFDNFAVHIVNLEGKHVGILQSVRELPGFLALLVVYVLLFIKEHRLSALSILLLGLGVSLTGLLPTFSGMIFTTLLMSFGFHYFETTNQSLTLQYFDKQTAPLVFGRLRSYAAASNIAASALILLFAAHLEYKTLYLLFGCMVVVSALWAFTQNPTDKDLVPQKKEMVFKKNYWLYYCLTFMAGARRQIFIAFAVFLLVKKFDFSVQEVAALFLLNNLINYFLSPYIGKCIVRYGERTILSIEYGALIIIFLCYATIDNKIAVALLYIFDHIFFNFAIAIKTFFQKIADPSDIAPSMAVGFTINHIAAVVLPVVGGIIWMIDYRIVFVLGAILGFGSLILVQFIPAQLKKMQNGTN